jgi:hypothetical protein
VGGDKRRTLHLCFMKKAMADNIFRVHEISCNLPRPKTLLFQKRADNRFNLSYHLAFNQEKEMTK